ncbi:MAG: hypothetical protein O2819_01675 [Planctomycetota bacterium]|nr:hypothetical protein [Planctomycetota bacterium]MDA1088463.1 hypothetical protein [Verrucomicrobiota bacterium]
MNSETSSAVPHSEPSAATAPDADANLHFDAGTKLSRYTAFLRWMASDAFWRFRWLVIGVIAAGAAAVALQIKAIALTIYYTHLFEDNKTFTLFGHSYHPRESMALLLGFGSAVLVALVISAVLQYASRVWTLLLRRRYAEFCSIRVLAILKGAPHTVPGSPLRFDDATATALVRSESLYCGRMVSIAVGVVTPAICFIASVGVLFYVHWTLTLLLVGMIGVCSIFLYRVNVKGALYSHLAEKHGRGAVAEYRRIVQAHKSAIIVQRDFDAETSVRSDPIKNYFDAYMVRLRVVADSELIGNIFLGVVLAISMVALGRGAILRGSGWEGMVAYLVALRYALVTFRGGVRTITSFNRFYPQVRRYFDFVRWSVESDAPPAPLPASVGLRCPSPKLEGSLRKFIIDSHGRIALCAPIDLNRYTLPFIIRCMIGNDPSLVRSIVASAAWATSSFRFPPGPISRSPGFDDPSFQRDFDALAAGSGLEQKIADQLSQGLATPMPEVDRDGINPAIKFLFSLVPVFRSRASWVFLDGNDLAALEVDARKQVLDRLAGRVTVILYNESLAGVGQSGEQVVAVHDAAEQIALGPISWFNEHRGQIQQIVLTAIPSRKARIDDDDDDDTDDDT